MGTKKGNIHTTHKEKTQKSFSAPKIDKKIVNNN